MKTGKILVVGGYGYVGRTISTVLANQFPGRVVAAGRNIRKAEELSQETDGKVLPLDLDIFDPEVNIEKVLEGVSQVVMCLDQPDTRIDGDSAYTPPPVGKRFLYKDYEEPALRFGSICPSS